MVVWDGEQEEQQDSFMALSTLEKENEAIHRPYNTPAASISSPSDRAKRIIHTAMMTPIKLAPVFSALSVVKTGPAAC